MPNAREIKGQINSVAKTKKITKTMELISMAKVKKASAKASESKVYSNEMKRIGDIVFSKLGDSTIHPLLQKNSSNRKLAIIFSTDRGLCGSLNFNLFSTFLKWAKNVKEFEVVTVGKKGKDFAIRANLNILASFESFSTDFSVSDILPIAKLISKSYLNGDFGEVYLFFTEFINMATQKSQAMRILPLEKSSLESDSNLNAPETEFLFEPNVQSVVNYLIPKLFEFQLYQSALENFASEHAARMLAMKNATDNAADMIDELTLNFNKARQAQITREIAEIVAGSMD